VDDWTLRSIELITGRRSAPARARSGDLVRVRHGAYVDATDWPLREREAAHFIRMQAVADRFRIAPVFSHRSAAILWGLPVLGAHRGVHVVATERKGARSRRGVVWHNDAIEEADVVEHGGMRVTSLERTLIDLARTEPFPYAVAALDRGLTPTFPGGIGGSVSGVARDRLAAWLDGHPRKRGIRLARTVLEFADARSGSVGESVSRANMHVAGFPAPDLQVEFPRYDGGNDVVDFDWPFAGRFGEFDGRGKYLREEFTEGRSVADVVLAEKEREDRIRRHRPFAIRWGWDIAMDADRLRRHLIAHGLHPAPR